MLKKILDREYTHTITHTPTYIPTLTQTQTRVLPDINAIAVKERKKEWIVLKYDVWTLHIYIQMPTGTHIHVHTQTHMHRTMCALRHKHIYRERERERERDERERERLVPKVRRISEKEKKKNPYIENSTSKIRFSVLTTEILCSSFTERLYICIVPRRWDSSSGTLASEMSPHHCYKCGIWRTLSDGISSIRE